MGLISSSLPQHVIYLPQLELVITSNGKMLLCYTCSSAGEKMKMKKINVGGKGKTERDMQRTNDPEACKPHKFSVKSCPLVPSCGIRATPTPCLWDKDPPRCNLTSHHPGLQHRDLPSDNAEAQHIYQAWYPTCGHLSKQELCAGERHQFRGTRGTLWPCLPHLNRNQAAKSEQGWARRHVHMLSTYLCARGFLPSFLEHTSCPH